MISLDYIIKRFSNKIKTLYSTEIVYFNYSWQYGYAPLLSISTNNAFCIKLPI